MKTTIVAGAIAILTAIGTAAADGPMAFIDAQLHRVTAGTPHGGGIWNQGTLTLTNSTVCGGAGVNVLFADGSVKFIRRDVGMSLEIRDPTSAPRPPEPAMTVELPPRDSNR